MIHHMVLVTFRDGVSAETIATALRELDVMRTRIPGIRYLAYGPYSSPEGLNQGYTHGFLITFEDAAARDSYLPHPEHERVKDILLPLVERVVAFDFAAES